MNSVTQPVALVTGAGSGIGAATARLFASRGMKVGLLSRTEKEIAAVAEEIRAAGGEALPLRADVSDLGEMTVAVERLRQEWGRLDVVFANAGVNGVWAPIDDLTVEEWDAVMAINARGTFVTVKAALPLLKAQGGAIVITSSVNGNRMYSNTGATAYACTKAAQVAFTKMTAVEFARYHVRVNAICPGFIESEIHNNTEKRNIEALRVPAEYPEGPIPLTGKRPGSPEQVAEVVYFLSTEASSHVTGAVIFVDGGQSLVQG